MRHTFDPPLRGEQDCGCRSCGHRFAGTGYFDQHRVGQNSTGRRCMTPDEMSAAGLVEDTLGRWRKPLGNTPQEGVQAAPEGEGRG